MLEKESWFVHFLDASLHVHEVQRYTERLWVKGICFYWCDCQSINPVGGQAYFSTVLRQIQRKINLLTKKPWWLVSDWQCITSNSLFHSQMSLHLWIKECMRYRYKMNSIWCHYPGYMKKHGNLDDNLYRCVQKGQKCKTRLNFFLHLNS